MSRRMHDYPVSDLLYGPYRYDRFDPVLIRGYLDQLVPRTFIWCWSGPSLKPMQPKPITRWNILWHPTGPLLTAWIYPPQSRLLHLPLPNPLHPDGS
ncbi:MAG: hypothetical protein CM1200mP20_11310 [Pseudomonadota bacterium]|nr:MAG: hypothetical protein CM1200mP20_11310 [Pseudomonadota bacterium]